MAIAALYQCDVLGEQEGQLTVNTFHFAAPDYEANQMTAALTDLALSMRTLWRAAAYACISSTWKMTVVKAKQIYPTKFDPIEVNAEAVDVGTLGTPLPSYNTQLLSWRTGQGGKGQKGKSNLPGVPEAGTDGSYLTDAHKALLQAFGDQLFAEYNVADPGANQWVIGVVSRRKDKQDVPLNLLAFHRYTTVIAQRLVAVQRRRKVGRGR